MKKFVLLMLALCAMSLGASAQRFALIDMEYILQNMKQLLYHHMEI